VVRELSLSIRWHGRLCGNEIRCGGVGGGVDGGGNGGFDVGENVLEV
jgi:hypothetical protein